MLKTGTSQRLTLSATLIMAGLLGAGGASAAQGPSPCQSWTAPGSWQLQLSAAGRGALDASLPGTVTQQYQGLRRESGAARPAGVALGFTHDYQIFRLREADADLAAPAGNGHMHRFSIPVQATGLLGESLQDWQLQLQPALAISSNLLKNKKQINHQALQVNAGFWRDVEGAGQHWRVGLCGDHRFGAFRFYPILAHRGQHAQWQWQLGFPESRLQRVWYSRRLVGALTLGPQGDYWYHYHSRLRDSRFGYRSWQFGLELGWQPHPQWSISAEVAQLQGGRYALLLDNNQSVTVSGGRQQQLSFTLRFHP